MSPRTSLPYQSGKPPSVPPSPSGAADGGAAEDRQAAAAQPDPGPAQIEAFLEPGGQLWGQPTQVVGVFEDAAELDEELEAAEAFAEDAAFGQPVEAFAQRLEEGGRGDGDEHGQTDREVLSGRQPERHRHAQVPAADDEPQRAVDDRAADDDVDAQQPVAEGGVDDGQGDEHVGQGAEEGADQVEDAGFAVPGAEEPGGGAAQEEHCRARRDRQQGGDVVLPGGAGAQAADDQQDGPDAGQPGFRVGEDHVLDDAGGHPRQRQQQRQHFEGPQPAEHAALPGEAVPAVGQQGEQPDHEDADGQVVRLGREDEEGGGGRRQAVLGGRRGPSRTGRSAARRCSGWRCRPTGWCRRAAGAGRRGWPGRATRRTGPRSSRGARRRGPTAG
ncbi:hypothetical protein GCM10020000_72360 [Streptomyces olivoverticillatus]